MTDRADFDIKSFQDDVLKVVSEIQREQKISLAEEIATVSVGSFAAWLVASPVTLVYIFKRWKNKGKKYKDVEEVGKEAEQVVKNKDVKKVLCPALQSASNDAYDIAKVITPILVPLILAGTISVPLNPLLFATIALVIARMSIASLCVEHKKPSEVKSSS